MELVEVEYRVEGNHKDLILKNYEILKVKNAQCKDYYISFDNGVLDRVRLVKRDNTEKLSGKNIQVSKRQGREITAGQRRRTHSHLKIVLLRSSESHFSRMHSVNFSASPL